MDTLIFGGLLATLFVLHRQRSRAVLLGGWWLMLVLTVALLAHHITSGLELGLSY